MESDIHGRWIQMSNLVWAIIALSSVVISISLVVWYRHNIKHTMNQISKMLDEATNESFTETTYDESALSALEQKFNRYLCCTLASEKNLTEERNKIKSLISDISHQTKTPVANISLYSQLLLECESLPFECVEMGKQINQQSQKLQFLIDALVKTSRLETGIISASPCVNSIKKLIEVSCADVKTKVDKKNITLQVTSNTVNANFDLKWTAEAVTNIIDNAVKYSPENSIISISVQSYELFSCINITDYGIGIAESEFPKIFQRFYRSQDVNQYEGVGIGLFLSREIISNQGGYIKVSSKIGQGSTFSIYLPNEKTNLS